MNRSIKTSPESFANYIMMLRNTPKYKDNTFILVENIPDSNLFKKLLNCDLCKIEPVKNKDEVIKVLRVLKNRSFISLFAIVDADFEYIDGQQFTYDNLFRTDTYNIESLLLKSKALEFLLLEKTNTEKLDKYLSKTDLRERLISSSKPIGLLRLISKRKNWKLKFNSLIFDNEFISKSDLDINIHKLIELLHDITPEFTLGIFAIEEEFDKYDLSTFDPWLICNGHDMMAILLIAYKYIFGKYVKNLNQLELESLLRLAYESRFFKETKLYDSICNWEKENPPFKVF